MWYVIALLSAIVFGFAGLFMKISQAKGGRHDELLLGLYTTGTVGFLINALAEGNIVFDDWRIWAAGLIVGIGSAWGNAVFMKALDYGPASLTSPLTNTNIVLIIAMSMLWYGETLSGSEWLGIACLLTAVVLISLRPGEALTIREKRWFVFILLAILLFTFRNGGLKVTQELNMPNTTILFIAYFFSLVWFAGKIMTRSYGSNSSAESASSDSNLRRDAGKIGFLWGLAAGVCSYAGMQLYSVALVDGQANIVAPIFATNSLVLVFGAILLYRERLTLKQTAALSLLVLGLVLVR
ncbi:EamA family transporter [Paenibacillus turpanensis]|uniref:EamA family transporter n=1 Tax=Paenibacillus turpanensis TaxID=2689078 RepID=UPI00140C45E7|nr:DMT family transporter [Paenibacillus turpanensis]